MNAIIVTGLGRCGSSLMMQMLSAGGVPTVGEWPDFEDKATMPGMRPEWLGRQNGAVKVLDPHRQARSVFAVDGVSIIWLGRDPEQQGKSQAKFLREMTGLPSLNRRDTKRLIGLIRHETRQSIGILESCRRPLLKLTFERLVTDPLSAAREVAAFIRPQFSADPERMAAEYFYRGPSPTDCLPHMLEADLLAEGRVA